jgi:hypothetical protein
MFIRLLSFILFISAMVLGNTYYVDYATGSDANAGTSNTLPWKRAPGMNGFSASYSHTAGDVFIFKGGVTWPSAALPFTITNSGATGKTDTYTTDHNWFAGSSWTQPVFDGQLFGKTLLSVTANYIKINDLRIINAGKIAANGIMAFQFINCSYLELSNNTFAPEAWGCLYISTEKTGNYYDILVHHNDISHCAFAMRFIPAAPNAIMHNVQAYNNNIHDFHSQLSGEVHGDGIQHYCSPDDANSYDRYIDGFKIFNNHFYGDFSQVAGSGGAMTALVYLSGSSKGVEIYNNVFAPQYSGSQSPNFFESFISLRDNPNRGGYHKIYNNTFVTPVAGGQAAAILEDDTRFPAPGLDIKNNIFSNFNWPFDLRSTNHTIDNNDEDFVRDIGKWAGNFVGSFAKWQALGLDVHGINVNPGFVSSTDQRLSATSPCIGKGANLSTIVSSDISGNVRPATGPFSLGAYEFGSTTPAPIPVPVPTPTPIPVPVPPGTPSLSSPLGGAEDVAINPTLTWNTVTTATSYTVQVSSNANFASPNSNQTGITSTAYSVNGLANGIVYYWRVNASNTDGTSAWSSTRSFTTVAAAPPAELPTTITLWWPGNGVSNIMNNPSLTWSPDAGALSYTLQVSTTPTFAALLTNQTGITATDFEVTDLAFGTTYYWRVKVIKSNGTTVWSAASSFTTVVPAQPLPTVTLWWPANNATGIVRDPTFTWSPDSSVLSYVLQVSTDSEFANVIMNQNEIKTNSFDATELNSNTAYYWRVKVLTAQGTGGWSPTSYFIAGSALGKGATGISDLNGQVGTRTMDVFSCKNGDLQISLPHAGVYSLTMFALNGQKAGSLTKNSNEVGRQVVSLRNMTISQGFYIIQLSLNNLTLRKRVYLSR